EADELCVERPRPGAKEKSPQRRVSPSVQVCITSSSHPRPAVCATFGRADPIFELGESFIRDRREKLHFPTRKVVREGDTIRLGELAHLCQGNVLVTVLGKGAARCSDQPGPRRLPVPLPHALSPLRHLSCPQSNIKLSHSFWPRESEAPLGMRHVLSFPGSS